MRPRSSSVPLVLLLAAALPATVPAEPTSPTPDGKAPKQLKCLAARAEPWPQGFVKMTIPGEADKFIAEQRITRITSADGADWTDRLLVEREALEADKLEVCYNEQYPRLPPLRGRPAPERTWFPVLQAGTLFKLNPYEVPGDRADALLAVDLGGMKNLGRRTSVGASTYLGIDPDQFRLGAKARLRYWFTRKVAVDLAPGIIVGGEGNDNGRYYSYPGFIGEAGLSLNDWMVVTGQVETRNVTRRQNVAWTSDGWPPPSRSAPREETAVTWSLGMKFGAELGLPGFILSALIVGRLAGGDILN